MRPLLLVLTGVGHVLAQTIIREAQDLVRKFDPDECQRKLRRSDPARKFEDDFLAEICDRQLSWFEDIIKSEGAAELLSAEQLAWLRGIWSCRDVSCICSQMDICRELAESSEASLLGGMGEARPRPWRGKRQAPPPSFLTRGLGPATRKEYRALSDAERRAFHEALNALKLDRIDNLSKYDILTVYHTPEQSPGAHFGPGLLPFHRELLKQLEVALRMENPAVALPYWDTTLDAPLPEPRDSILWTGDFFGSGVGEVRDGPFANWQTIHDAQIPQLSPRRRIVRTLGTNNLGALLKPNDIADIMRRSVFQNLTWCVDPFFELIHGQVHMWVGGHMHEMRISPNDPTFFVYHSFIDKIWEEWRLRHQTPQSRQVDYVPDAQACNTFHQARSQMRPFRMSNQDGLSNLYTRDFYRFEASPRCSWARQDCGSAYLFCEVRGQEPRCISKVRPGGVCRGFEGTDICFRSTCVRGLCAQSQPQPRRTPPPTTTTTTTTRPPPTTTRTSAPRVLTTTLAPRLVRLRNRRRQVWLKFFASLRDEGQKPATTSTTTTARPTTTPRPATRRPRRRRTTTRRPRTRKPRTRATTRRPSRRGPRVRTARPRSSRRGGSSSTRGKSKRRRTFEEAKARLRKKTRPSARGSRGKRRGKFRFTTVKVTVPSRRTRPPRIVRTTTARPNPAPTFRPALSEPVHSVWVPIMVMRMTGRNAGEAMSSGLIVSEHVDDAGRPLEVLEGQFGDPEKKPYYTGSAFAQLRSPFASSLPVKAEISVLDEKGLPCVATCLQGPRTNTSLATYNPCRAQIRLSQDPSTSDDVPFSPFLENARTLMWRDRGRRKEPDKFLFMCNAKRVPGATTRFSAARQRQEASSLAKRSEALRRGTQVSFTDASGSGRRRGGGATQVRTVPLPASEWRAEGGCHNAHRCCDIWASVGECRRSGWMRRACKRSCFICSDGAKAERCGDFHPKCAEWAREGQCRANAVWMEENCRRSCKTCDRSPAMLAEVCEERGSGGELSRGGACEDGEAKCGAWARRGECDRNPWMRRNCPEACGDC